MPDIIVGPRLRGAALRFVQADFVRPEDYPAFDRAIARALSWRDSVLAEVVILGLALAGPWTIMPDTLYGEGATSWMLVSSEAGARLSLAGIWYKFVAVPVVQFFWFRWLWRLVTRHRSPVPKEHE